MRFRIDDIVRISKTSKWYGKGEFNPADVNGKIERLLLCQITYPIVVMWDTGERAYFDEETLRLVRRADEV